MAREINFELGARAALLQRVFEVAEAAKFTMAALVQSVSELREAFRVTMGSKVLDFYIMCTERAQCVMELEKVEENVFNSRCSFMFFFPYSRRDLRNRSISFLLVDSGWCYCCEKH